MAARKPAAKPVKQDKVKVEVAGRVYEADPDYRDDFELLAWVGRLDAGDPTVLAPILQRVLGDEQANNAVDSLRGEDGIVRINSVRTFIVDFLTASNAKN